MKKYTIYDHNFEVIGQADSFKDCMAIHKKHYEQFPDMLERYAGLACSGTSLNNGYARPQFYK